MNPLFRAKQAGDPWLDLLQGGIYKLLGTKRPRIPILISLTSTQARLPFTHLTILSLLRQSVIPDKIILWLSEDPYLMDNGIKKHEVPMELRKLQGELFSIQWTDNIGSYRKLIPTLKQYGLDSRAVLTVDDDVYYRPTFLSHLYRNHLVHPTHILCRLSRKVCWITPSEFAPYESWPVINESQTRQDVIPVGQQGILYPPGSLDGATLDVHTLKDLCPSSDDLWFRLMSLMKGTPISTMVHPRYSRLTRNTDILPLWKRNLDEKHNDKQLAALERVYGFSSRMRSLQAPELTSPPNLNQFSR